MIFCYLKQYLQTDFAENLLARKKIQIKAWFSILGAEIMSYVELHCKSTQISQENKLYSAVSEKSLDSLAINL